GGGGGGGGRFCARGARSFGPRPPTPTAPGGVRLDHSPDGGPSLTPRLAFIGALPGWLQKPLPKALKDVLSYRIGYARAFRAPTLAELYYDLPGGTSNRDLEPTTADSFEGALLYKHARLTAEATASAIPTSSTIA